MNTRKILTTISAFAAVFVSCNKTPDCEKVTRIDTPATVSLNIQDLEDTVVLMSPKSKSYTLTARASALADELLTITIKADPQKVHDYNNAHGTSFEIVPAEACQFSTDQLLLPRYNTVSSTSQLTLKSEKMPEDGLVHILPVTISKIVGDDILMTPEDSTLYVFFRRKSLPASGYELGSGTESDPYVIRNQLEMISMSKALKEGQTTFFKMEEDVDMSDFEDWVPLNTAAPYKKHVSFDGNSHRIIGFTCNAVSYPSFFGALMGTVRNVTFENPVIVSGTSPAGLLGAVVGDTETPALIENVKVSGLRIESTGTSGAGDNLGGLFGVAVNTTFNKVDVELQIIDADDNNKMPKSVGGLVGYCTGVPSTFKDCHVKGAVKGAHSTAGMLGYAAVGGVVISHCSAAVDITSFGNYAGGLLGYSLKGISISDSHASGNVTGGGNYAGGLVGATEGEALVSRCYATGNVTTTKGNHIGGLVGNIGIKSGNSLVEDCYASGNVSVHGENRMVGGLIGVVENVMNITIRRCFASGDVSSEQRQAGGLLSVAKMKKLDDMMNFTMEKCIAWNASVTTHPTAENNWSSGGIIGVTNINNTLTDNFRRSDMNFLDQGEWILFDQSNVSQASPLEGYNAPLNQYPYHGKASPVSSTLSSVAKSLAWPENVWDLSGDVPVLK